MNNYPATEQLAILLLMQQQPNRPFTVTQLAEQTSYPVQHVQQIFDRLMEAHLVTQTRDVIGGDIGYMTMIQTLQRQA